jgi:ketosteroid isomerase-like protein
MASPTTQEQDLHAERLAVLERFGQAWARADIEQLMSLITDDCVYSASVGPEPGCTYAGHAAVREGFASMLAFDASGEPREGRTFVAGCLAVAEWSYVHRSTAGDRREVRGCDIVEFRGRQICRKDAFRKCEAA